MNAAYCVLARGLNGSENLESQASLLALAHGFDCSLGSLAMYGSPSGISPPIILASSSLGRVT
ncbi:MAG: hypothetical protein NTZ98_02815 [Acidobacteria bacterium]|jgi:hypothetical protein|nr:hypothetical protein [Acidobacteriota bacterium]